MARIGTAEWADQTGGGHVRIRDWLELLVLQAPSALLGDFNSWIRWRLGTVHDVDVAIPIGPQSALASKVDRLCRAAYDDWLLDHCYRTYAIGYLLARSRCLEERLDNETWWLCSMLHDLGLVRNSELTKHLEAGNAYVRSPSSASCFAVRGASLAESLVDDAEPVASAIRLHLNLKVGVSKGVEAHLLKAATALDVAGVRRHELTTEAMDSVPMTYRRDNWAETVWRTWSGEVATNSGCRAGVISALGLKRRLRNAPQHGSPA